LLDNFSHSIVQITERNINKTKCQSASQTEQKQNASRETAATFMVIVLISEII